MAVVGITGGTGLVGSQVAAMLAGRGHEVVIFTRNAEPKPAPARYSYAYWDAEREQCDVAALSKIDAVIHLAGEPVAGKRWTQQQKARIRNSRVQGTEFLVTQLRAHAPKCKTFIGASGMGFYGPDRGTPFVENDQPSDDFLGETCRMWEAEQQKAAAIMRTVILRFSIVLASEGGAFPEFVRPLSFGVMPVLGDGQQIISWIHIRDLASFIVYVLENERIQGVYNVATASPLSNRQLMLEISKTKGGFHIPMLVPSLLLKLALGEMSVEVLKSCTLNSDKMKETGFVFTYPEIKDALHDLLHK